MDDEFDNYLTGLGYDTSGSTDSTTGQAASTTSVQDNLNDLGTPVGVGVLAPASQTAAQVSAPPVQAAPANNTGSSLLPNNSFISSLSGLFTQANTAYTQAKPLLQAAGLLNAQAPATAKPAAKPAAAAATGASPVLLLALIGCAAFFLTQRK